jgi:anti-sigma B factor antagonist
MHVPLKLTEVATAPGSCTLAVDGELDIATAAEFKRAVGGLLGTGCRHLEVDLSATSFLDSSGLGALVWAAHRLRGAGGDMRVVNPSERVTQTLRLTQTEQLLVAG